MAQLMSFRLKETIVVPRHVQKPDIFCHHFVSRSIQISLNKQLIFLAIIIIDNLTSVYVQ